MTTENLDQKRVNWLDLAKQITLKAVERDSVYTHDLCPNSYKPDEKEKKEALKRVSDLTRDLNTLTSRMQILERDGTIGAKLLLNTEPDEIVRSVLAAMVTVKFSAEAARNLKRVSDAVMEVLKRRAIDSHGGLLFPNENGNKIAENHSRDRLKRLFSAVGIASTRRLHWHSWRNHFIIRCLDGGLGVHHIMKFTGHDSVRMVMRYADARTKENGFKAFKLLPPRQGRNGETANSLS